MFTSSCSGTHSWSPAWPSGDPADLGAAHWTPHPVTPPLAHQHNRTLGTRQAIAATDHVLADE